MEIRIAKELLHLATWLDRIEEIINRGENEYLTDELLQEAETA